MCRLAAGARKPSEPRFPNGLDEFSAFREHNPVQRRAPRVESLDDVDHRLLSRCVHRDRPERRDLRRGHRAVLNRYWHRCGPERIPDRGRRRASGSKNALGDQKTRWRKLGPKSDLRLGA